MNEFNEAKVFGWIYCVIFETGSVKVGMSIRNPKLRIASHTNAGANFGVKVLDVHMSRIFTEDVRLAENELIAYVCSIANGLAGREWFQLPSIEAGAKLCKEKMNSMEESSFIERPSISDLDKKDRRGEFMFKSGLGIGEILHPNGSNIRETEIKRGISCAEFLQQMSIDSFFNIDFFKEKNEYGNKSSFALICGAYLASLTEKERIDIFESIDDGIDNDDYSGYFDLFSKSRTYVKGNMQNSHQRA